MFPDGNNNNEAIIEDEGIHRGIIDANSDDNDTTEPSINMGDYNPTQTSPSKPEAAAALDALRAILKPCQKNGIGHIDSRFDSPTCDHLQGMKMLLVVYLDTWQDNINRCQASLKAAQAVERGEYYAKCLQRWVRNFIADNKCLPENAYGTWKESLLEHEDLKQELTMHLQSLGVHVCVQDLINYLDCDDIKVRLKLKGTISLAMA